MYAPSPRYVVVLLLFCMAVELILDEFAGEVEVEEGVTTVEIRRRLEALVDEESAAASAAATCERNSSSSSNSITFALWPLSFSLTIWAHFDQFCNVSFPAFFIFSSSYEVRNDNIITDLVLRLC